VGRTGCALFIPGAAGSSTASGQQPCILYEVGQSFLMGERFIRIICIILDIIDSLFIYSLFTL
jgi:hypothetical protein